MPSQISKSSFESFPFDAFQENYHAIDPDKSHEVDHSEIIEKLSQQVNILQEEVSQKEELLSKRDAEYSKLEKDYETCENKRRKLTEQLDLAMVKFDELTEDFNRQSAAHDSGSTMMHEIESLQSRLEEKARENARFHQTIQRLNKDKESLEATVAAMQDSHGEMTSVFDQYQTQKNTFADIMHQKTLEIEDYRLQVDRLKTENSELNRLVAQGREDVGQHSVSVGDLQNQVEMHRNAVARLTERNSGLEDENSRYEQRLNSLEASHARIQTDNSWLKTQLQKKTEEYETVFANLRSQEASNQTSEISKLALGESNMDLKNRLVQLEAERDELKSQIERNKSALQQVQSSHVQGEASRTSQKQKISELQEKMTAYENQIVTLENEAKVKDADLLNCANLLQEHKSNVLRLQAKVKDFEDKESEFQKLRTEHLQLEMNHRTLKRDLERSSQQLQYSSKRYESRDETIEKLRKENEELNKANVKFNQSMVQIGTQIDSLTADRNHFRKLYKESQIELEGLRKESERATLAKFEAEASSKTCETRIQSLGKEIAHYQSLERTRLASLTEGLERTKRVEGEKQNLVREMTLLIEEKTKFLNRSKMLEGELRKLEDIKHQQSLELERAKNSLAEQSVVIQEKDSNYIKLDSVCKCQEQENKTLRGQLRQLEQQQELHRREARNINEEMKELRSKLREITEKASKYQISLKEELLRRESAQDELMHSQETLHKMQVDFHTLSQGEKEYQMLIQELRDSTSKLNEEIRRRDQSIQQLENSHKDVTHKFNEMIETYKHLQSAYREKESEVSAQMNEILRLRNQLESYMNDNGHLSSSLQKQKDTLQQAANDVRSIQTDREVLRKQLIRKGEEIGRVRRALDEKCKENQKIILKLDEYKRKMQEGKQGYELLKRKYDGAKQEATNYVHQLQHAGVKYMELKKKYSTVHSQSKDLKQRLKSKSTALESSGQRLKQVLCRESAMQADLESTRRKLLKVTKTSMIPQRSERDDMSL